MSCVEAVGTISPLAARRTPAPLHAHGCSCTTLWRGQSQLIPTQLA
ncbi:MAG TPA: hypothetical protein VKM55_02305 [Candidatus Lokiarchaeia archaeon]|nr:hypothetical protein [Candidatus Lokiarchaeia archaeon]